MIEVESWPYNFPASEDFPHADQRGRVTGRLQIKDRYLNHFGFVFLLKTLGGMYLRKGQYSYF